MATETENLLISLDIKGSEEELRTMVKLNQAIAETKKEITRLGDTNKVESERNKTALKNQQQAYRDVQKSIQNQNKAANENIKTLEGMRAKLSNMNKEITKLEVGSEPFKKMQAEAKKLRGEIGQAEEGMGVFNRNVGNYENAITSAFQKMGINIGGVTGTVKGLGTAMSASTQGVTGASKALKIFKIALISTGIGAIVVALGFLVVAMSKMQAVTDAVNRVLTPLATMMQRMIGIAQDLGSIFRLITKGEAGWSDLGDAIGTVGDQMRQAYNEGQRIADLTVEIEQLEIKRIRTAAKITRAMNEQREILQNVTKTDEERKKAGEEYLRLQEQDVAQQTEIAKKEIERLELKFKQNDTDREAQKELETARAKLDEIEATASQRRLEAKNQLNSIDKRAADDAIAAAKEQEELDAKSFEERKKRREAQRAEEAKAEEARLAAILLEQETRDKLLADYQQKLAEFQEANRVSQLSDEEKQLDAVDKRYQALIDLAIEAGQEISDLEEQRSIERNDIIYDIEKTALEKRKDLVREEAEFKKTMDEKVLAAKYAALQAGLDIVGSFAKKGSAIEKAAAVLSATINTWVAANQTLADPTLPTLLKAILVGTTIATGLANVAKIVSTPAPGFAGGVIGIQGPGTRTSDGIPAYLSKGEAVMTADVVDAFAPQLAGMELAVGNKPNYQVGNRRFAAGFLPQREPNRDIMLSQSEQIERLAAKINDKKVFVYEQDISRTQRDVQRIKVAGDL